MSDDLADPVQPEGQGEEEQTSDAPYAEYLDRIPEEYRDVAEEAFRASDANATRKFQEAAEYRKNWEPYEQLGVNQVDPAELQELLQFRQALDQNPQGVQEWYQQYAQERGLADQQPAQQGSEEEQPWVDPGVQALIDQSFQQHLGPLRQQLEDLSGWQQAQEQQASEQRIHQEIQSELEALKAKHGDEFQEDLVDKFVANHFGETDPRVAVQKAFADAQAFRNQIEKGVLQRKADAPASPEGGGGVVADDGLPKTLAEATAQAAAQLRAAREG